MSKVMQSLTDVAVKIVVVLLVVSPINALAKVELVNTIQKIERYVDEGGDLQRRMVDAESVVPGDELRYVVRFVNHGDQVVDAGTIVITDVIPEHTQYLQGTAFGPGTDIEFSVDGDGFALPGELTHEDATEQEVASPADYQSIRWTFSPELKPGEASYVSFNVRLL